jgi:hypothetical protein
MVKGNIGEFDLNVRVHKFVIGPKNYEKYYAP